MAYIKATNIRDGTPYSVYLSVYTALAKTGVKFVLEQAQTPQGPLTTINSAGDTARADTLVAAVPGSVEGMEGANEYDITSYNLTINGTTYNSESYGVQWGVLDDQNLQTAVATDPNLSGVPVIAASVEDVTHPATGLGPYINLSNSHVYYLSGQQLQATEVQELGWDQTSAPGKPVWVTEAGISSSGYASSNVLAADAYTQGLIDLNVVLDGWYNGVPKTFLYDLVDDGTNPTDLESNFGLFDQAGNPKPVATNLHNLMTVLADSGTVTSPGTLSYSLAGMPGTALSMLLQKSDGSFWIAVWNATASLSNGTSDVVPPTSNITVTFAKKQSTTTFDPVAGTKAIASANNTTTVALALSADPLIVEIAAPVAANDTPAIPSWGLWGMGALFASIAAKSLRGRSTNVNF
jgi:hypothetical protein